MLACSDYVDELWTTVRTSAAVADFSIYKHYLYTWDATGAVTFQYFPTYIYIFFDGTTNNSTEGTNIWNSYNGISGTKYPFVAQHDKDAVEYQTKSAASMYAIYIAGVGTTIGSDTIRIAAQKMFGGGIGRRSIIAYEFLVKLIDSKDPDAELQAAFKLKIMGYSRGAKTARCFTVFLYHFGITPLHLVRSPSEDGLTPFENKYLNNVSPSTKGFVIPVAFLGLYDTVATLYTKLQISSDIFENVIDCYHAVGMHEDRGLFKLKVLPVRSEKWKEQFYLGSHQDIGGFKDNVRQLITLRDMIKFGLLEHGMETLALSDADYLSYTLTVQIHPTKRSRARLMSLQKKPPFFWRKARPVNWENGLSESTIYFAQSKQISPSNYKAKMEGISAIMKLIDPASKGRGLLSVTDATGTHFTCFLTATPLDTSSLDIATENTQAFSYTLTTDSGTQIVGTSTITFSLEFVGLDDSRGVFDFNLDTGIAEAVVEGTTSTLECEYPITDQEFTPSEDVTDAPATAPVTLPAEGQSVQCTAGGAAGTVYRVTKGELRSYHDAVVADFWDPNWMQYIAPLNCTTLTIGLPMIILPTEGEPLLCGQGGTPGTVYRMASDHLAPYDSPEIATSWDPNWQAAKTYDCRSIKIGATMMGPLPGLNTRITCSVLPYGGAVGDVYLFFHAQPATGTLDHLSKDITLVEAALFEYTAPLDCSNYAFGFVDKSQKLV